MELQREKIRLIQLEDSRRQERQAVERQKAAVEKENSLMKQWEIVCANIRQLRQDLQQSDLTRHDQNDILEDIEGFKAKKRKLALKLELRGSNE